MKNIKKYVMACLVMMTLASLTACGNDSMDENSTTVPSTAEMTQGTTQGTNGNGPTTEGTGTGMTDNGNERETGVIDGVIDDIGEGVENIGEDMTNATTETTR